MDAPAVCALQEQRILVGRRREHSLEVPPRLAQMPTDVPEPAQCDRQPQRALAFTRLQEECERRACVVMLELEAREPLGLALSAQLGLGALGEREEPLGMPSPRPLCAELLQTLGGVLANRLEQAVPRLALRSPNQEKEASARPSTSSRARPSSPSTQTVATASSVAPPRKADSRASSSRSSSVSRP